MPRKRKKDKPLTDEEIARKFCITIDSPQFALAKRLSRSGRDKTVCNVPMLKCPWCGHDWQWDDYYQVAEGDDIECPRCERTMYVVYVESTIVVHLNTHSGDEI